ncbi:hypothetical protein BKA65DRAFT_519076 [Rhexocercosporidium sp. MPI-PUGE-AT-0058]|nr:hypothetical protein BKA65DRAFT_519076 [Rhexocercosporidium sp. MPI-PUGE-AT-0058]
MVRIRTRALLALLPVVTPLVDTATAKPLVPFVYGDIPLGSITPNGWLRQELETEAAGLAGHLYDFWNYVHRSSWLGGDQEYSGLNEAFPYWLNGLVPLAYVLDDPRLKAQVHEAMDYLMKNMVKQDGWIGPEANGPGGGYRMIWARSLVFFAWTNLADANKTWEQPIVEAMHKFNNLQVAMLSNNCTGEQLQAANTVLNDGYYFWGRGRVQEMIYSLQWLYDKHPESNEAKLLEGMNLLHSCGWNWEDWFVKGVYPTGDVRDYPDIPYQFVHGVNVGEGLKAPAVIRRYTYNDSLVQTARDGSDWTFRYHGSTYGSIIADEGQVGLDPWSGSETCTAVEVIFSQAYNYRAIGDSSFADSAEMSAFNALPGAMTGDWWSHVYMSESNQPFSKNLSMTPFSNVNTVGQTYGLEPDYPCCTVNHPQGLPKFLQSTFVTAGDDGIVHALLSPATVQTTLKNGAQVEVECQTNYPFEDVLFYDITTDKPITFKVRVPEWATSAQLASAGDSTTDVSSGQLGMAISVGSTRLMYTLGADVRTTAREHDTIAVLRGQLVYALQIDAGVTSTPPHSYRNGELYPEGYAPAQSRDYTMLNQTEWAVAIDPATIKFVQANPFNYTLNSDPIDMPGPIFAPGAPPTSMTVQACAIKWPLLAPGSIPVAPPTGANRKCLGDPFEAKLVPYGSAKIRMTELPTLTIRVP